MWRSIVATLIIKDFPDRLYERIERLARENQRSVSEEVVQLLDKAVSEVPRMSLLELDGLGKDAWTADQDTTDYIAEERDAWR
jgi:hypothetical protein